MEVLHNGPMQAEQYHSDPAPVPSLSASIAKILIGKSPAHARAAHPKLTAHVVSEDRETFDIGTAAHALLLEGMDVMVEVPYDEWRTKAAKELREEIRAAGKIPMLSKHVDSILNMAGVARNFLSASDLDTRIEDFSPEHTVVWKDDHIFLRARFDLVHRSRPLILDYKTTDDANPWSFCRQIVAMGYELQVTHYCDALRAIRQLDQEPTFIFFVQERSYPYACSLVGADPSIVMLGNDKMVKARALWRDCLSSDNWPAYSKSIFWAESPAWALASWEQRR
jgi:ATP-dependent exoDNAse (exonuclease V) beta subunit